MACIGDESVIICTSTAIASIRRVMRCPTCEQRRRMIIEDFAWYGFEASCCACGDRWDEFGERAQRPFLRGWRAKAIAEAKAKWAAPFDRRAEYWAEVGLIGDGEQP